LQATPAFSMRCFQRLFPLGGGVLLLALATLTLTSCGSFDAASGFASKAQRAIGKGVPILSDLTGSCIRRHLADTPFSEFESSGNTPQAGCSAFADREQGIIATAKVLSDYFSALSQLASAGTVSTGEHASSAASSAVKLAHLSGAQSSAVTSLASAISARGIESYKRKQILELLQKADPSVAEITGGLVAIINSDYVGSDLAKEQQASRRRSSSFVEAVAANPQTKASVPVTTILLQMQWKADIEQLTVKRVAASAYAQALTQIAEGHHALTKQAGKLKDKELTALMQTYTQSLSVLTERIDKFH
jgi:hypothetical protein